VCVCGWVCVCGCGNSQCQVVQQRCLQQCCPQHTTPQRTATLHHTATRCSTLQHTATHTATHCSTLQHTTIHYITPQLTATHHSATHSNCCTTKRAGLTPQYCDMTYLHVWKAFFFFFKSHCVAETKKKTVARLNMLDWLLNHMGHDLNNMGHDSFVRVDWHFSVGQDSLIRVDWLFSSPLFFPQYVAENKILLNHSSWWIDSSIIWDMTHSYV